MFQVRKMAQLPTESIDEFHFRELAKLYKGAKNDFRKITLKYINKFNSFNDSTDQKRLFSRLYLSKKVYDIIRKSFATIVTSRELMVSCYISATKVNGDSQISTVTIYPNQKKIYLLRKSAHRSASKFILLVESYLKENPIVLYTLPCEFIQRFLEKHSTISLIVFGNKLVKSSANKVIAVILRDKYEQYRIAWRDFIIRHFPFPEEIGIIIIDMLIEF